MDAVGPYLTAILPTILVAVLFYFLIKSMIEGDRRERLAQKRFEKEEDARTGRVRTERPSSSGPVAPEGPSDDPGNPTGNGQRNSDEDS